MLCRISCLVATVLVISSITFTFLIDKTVPKQYVAQLPPDTQVIYQKVVAERRRLANQGLLIGLVVGIILALAFTKNRMVSTCVVAASALGTQYLYYMLAPKSEWMIRYMRMREEREAWLGVYRHYQRMYHVSVLLGVIGAAVMGFGVCQY